MAGILIIDDEPNIRTMMKLALQHVGHKVETAADGREGLEKYGTGEDWDLVLLDQRMPGMEGLEVLKVLRHQNRLVRVIMVTAFGTVDLAVDSMKAGATDFLRKPFTADILRGAVAGALNRAFAPGELDGSSAQTTPLTFGMSTINGFRIEFVPEPGVRAADGLRFEFTVRHPDGEAHSCTVILSEVVMELVKAELDRETPPGGSRFWQALCEESLVNYVFQNAAFPPEDNLRIDDLTTGLRRYVHAIALPAVSGTT